MLEYEQDMLSELGTSSTATTLFAAELPLMMVEPYDPAAAIGEEHISSMFEAAPAEAPAPSPAPVLPDVAPDEEPAALGAVAPTVDLDTLSEEQQVALLTYCFLLPISYFLLLTSYFLLRLNSYFLLLTTSCFLRLTSNGLLLMAYFLPLTTYQ